MSVAIPIFQMGFKDDISNIKDEELITREVTMKILLEILIGRSSKLYSQLYEDGLINNTFEFDYTNEENYAYSIIGGESKEPYKVREKLFEIIECMLKNGVCEEAFERVKKATYGRTIRWFNSLEKVSEIFISSYFKKNNVFDYFNIYDKINLEYLTKLMKEHFKLDRFAISVIKGV